MDVNVDDQIPTDFDREKWRIEKGFRERELVIKEAELELRRNEQAGSGWRNPLVVAILAATVAAAGNAFGGRKRSFGAGFRITEI